MIRLACLCAFAALVLVPVAAADGGGPDPGVVFGWTGATLPGLPFRYVTLPAGRATVVAIVRRSTGRVWNSRALTGTWGVPMVAGDGTSGGLTADGRLLVLAEWKPATTYGALRARSRFVLLSTKSLHVWRRITLLGDFTYDALSPGGGTLYLIQHLSSRDVTTYRVRAYDLASQRLLPSVIADRRQSGWVMHGSPVTRATTPGGRWVYTLYQQPGGYPFVHALDTARRTAICVGIPWKGDQNILPATRLALEPGGRTLTLTTRTGRALFAVDTRTFWVSRVTARKSGFWSFLRL
jgi:hypothetical protein